MRVTKTVEHMEKLNSFGRTSFLPPRRGPILIVVAMLTHDDSRKWTVRFTGGLLKMLHNLLYNK